MKGAWGPLSGAPRTLEGARTQSGPPGSVSRAGRVGRVSGPRSADRGRDPGAAQRPNSTVTPSLVFDVPRSRYQSWKFWVEPAEIVEALLPLSVKSMA